MAIFLKLIRLVQLKIIAGFVSCFLIISPSICGADTSGSSDSLCADKKNNFLVAFPENLAPWSWMENGKPTGYLVDLMHDALAKMGKCLNVRMLPLNRIEDSFQSPNVMAIAWGDTRFHMPAHKDAILSLQIGVLHDIFAYMQNSGIHLDIGHISELNNISIISFKGVADVYPELKGVVEVNPNLRQIADQHLQTEAFFKRKYKIFMGEENIFQWWRRKGLESADSSYYKQKFDTLLVNKFVYNDATKASELDVVFRSKDTRDQFNAILLKMKSDGEVAKILNKYHMEFHCKVISANLCL